jgi:hypothetical protein
MPSTLRFAGTVSVQTLRAAVVSPTLSSVGASLLRHAAPETTARQPKIEQ